MPQRCSVTAMVPVDVPGNGRSRSMRSLLPSASSQPLTHPASQGVGEGKGYDGGQGDRVLLLSLYRDLVHLRNESAALRFGETILLDSGHPSVYATLRVGTVEPFLGAPYRPIPTLEPFQTLVVHSRVQG
jgi:hypothetical protein